MYPLASPEPRLPCVADAPEAGGPRLLQGAPDVVRPRAQPRLLQEEKGRGEDELGAPGSAAGVTQPPGNVHGGWIDPRSYLEFAFLLHHLEVEMGQLDCP